MENKKYEEYYNYLCKGAIPSDKTSSQIQTFLKEANKYCIKGL